VLPQFVLIALATLISEDLTCIATGVLIAQGQAGFAEGTLACVVGIFAGDILLFLAGRLAGNSAMRWPPLARLLPAERVNRAAAWLNERGLAVIFLSRFTPGLRLPTYFAAGLLPTQSGAFFGYFLLASLVWTPLLVGAAAIFGERFLNNVLANRSHGLAGFGIAFCTAYLLYRIVPPLFRSDSRRRMWAELRAGLQWEFWPAWAAYLPFMPYFAWLAVKYRSLTLFTASNPGIASGGFAFESKSESLRYLRHASAAAQFTVIPAALDPEARLAAACDFLEREKLAFPVVIKPDVGERGSGVVIVRQQSELEMRLQEANSNLILQEYVAGLEFGISYRRMPFQAYGEITGITHKAFPVLVGDGLSTLRELILRDRRASCMAETYEKLTRHSLDGVPAKGEAVQLVEIGSHCRGAIFLDASNLRTPELERRIDSIAQAHPEFYLGRFDVRVPSLEDFQSGRNIKVLELNGVTGEATHIYDPKVGIIHAYRTMFEHWRSAFEIGAINRERGFSSLTLPDVLRLVLGKLSGGGLATAATGLDPLTPDQTAAGRTARSPEW